MISEMWELTQRESLETSTITKRNVSFGVPAELRLQNFRFVLKK
ncbi:hypothetical protein [Leptospira adleri]|nr:hypothetical protein [Leptospira adleri]